MDIHARREFPEPVRALILLRLVGVVEVQIISTVAVSSVFANCMPS